MVDETRHVATFCRVDACVVVDAEQVRTTDALFGVGELSMVGDQHADTLANVLDDHFVCTLCVCARTPLPTGCDRFESKQAPAVYLRSAKTN
jgi:hypothetical protein